MPKIEFNPRAISGTEFLNSKTYKNISDILLTFAEAGILDRNINHLRKCLRNNSNKVTCYFECTNKDLLNPFGLLFD
jgi:hypothetical protein